MLDIQEHHNQSAAEFQSRKLLFSQYQTVPVELYQAP